MPRCYGCRREVEKIEIREIMDIRAPLCSACTDFIFAMKVAKEEKKNREKTKRRLPQRMVVQVYSAPRNCL